MFSTFRTTAIGAAALALAAGFAAPARANLITDPGFESCLHIGDSPPPGWTGAATCGGSPHSGTFDADFSGSSPSLSQSIPTAVGATYDFSFWLRDIGVLPSNGNFTASFSGHQVLNLTPPSNGIFPYTFEDFTVTATAVTTTIQFARVLGLQAGGTWALDDVSVTLAPEPASLTLLAVGLAGLGMVLRLRRDLAARPD